MDAYSFAGVVAVEAGAAVSAFAESPAAASGFEVDDEAVDDDFCA